MTASPPPPPPAPAPISPNASFFARPKKAIVLFAYQAPTLLALLENPAWDLRVERMGDDVALAEGTSLAFRPIGDDVPDVIVVCSPAHLENARARMAAWSREVPIVWAVHNGVETGLTGQWAGPILAFSASNLHAHIVDRPVRDGVFVIRPHVPDVPASIPYPSASRRRTTPPTHAILWTMQNRPSTRTPAARRYMVLRDEVLAERGLTEPGLTVFGQDQPAGFLDAAGKARLLAEGGTYVSVLPPTAGFGLAEHEMLAHGVPLVALAWGDAHHTLADYPGIVHTRRELGDRLIEVSEPGFWTSGKAAAWVAAGRRALRRHYDGEQARASIVRFVTALVPRLSETPAAFRI